MKGLLVKQWWNAKRFGLTPDKWLLRLSNPGVPQILCVSIPKAGTHLLERALCMHPKLYRPVIRTQDEANHSLEESREVFSRMKPGQIIVSHLFYTPQLARLLREHEIRCVFIVRDLRDIVISEANYLAKNTGHIYHSAFAGLDNKRDRIIRCLEGGKSSGLPSMAWIFDAFRGWLDSDALTVRFEDLIGNAGGGDAQRQLDTVKRIYSHLDIPCDEALIRRLADGVFSNASPTFHKGHTAQWQRTFDDQTKQLFKELTGDALVAYGYERSTAW